MVAVRSGSSRLFPIAGLLLFAFGTLALACVANGQDGAVDFEAVIRRGPSIEHVDGAFERSVEHVVAEAMEQIPDDDRDKWFVSIVKGEACPACDRLLADWKVSPRLRSIAKLDPAEGSTSWAKLSIYRAEDASQKHRWAKVKFSGVPAIVIQAPISGKFGPATDVVFQRCGYGGDADQLASDIRDAMRLRIEKFAPGLLEKEHAALRVALTEAATRRPPVQAVNNLPAKPPIDGVEGLLPLFPDEESPEIPPVERLRDVRRAAGIFAKVSELWSACDGACQGWLAYVLVPALIVAAQQFVTRNYPDEATRPGWAKFLLSIPVLNRVSGWLDPKPSTSPASAAAPGPAVSDRDVRYEQQLRELQRSIDRITPKPTESFTPPN